jgi:hypothetical protein
MFFISFIFDKFFLLITMIVYVITQNNPLSFDNMNNLSFNFRQLPPIKTVNQDLLPYFGFGSNMSRKQLRTRNVYWDSFFSVFINNYSLTFNKKSSRNLNGNACQSYANITTSLNDKVYGLLYYGLTINDYNNLDRYEGVNGGHYLKKVVSVIKDKHIVKAITYISGEQWVDDRGNCKPSKKYLDKLWEGKDYLPLFYQEMLKSVELIDGSKYRDHL